MCGGFTCSKNSLLALNILYIVVAFILIGVAAGARWTSIVTSLSVISVIIACGVFLLLIAIVGLCGASKHHQVMLFFYMIVLFFIFIIQFSVACACLAMSKDQQANFAEQGWEMAGNSTKNDAQKFFHCCGYNETDTGHMNYPSCKEVENKDGDLCCDKDTPEEECCRGDRDPATCRCTTCAQPIQEAMSRALNLVGGIGLFFSFTELFGFFVAKQYRHQMDPRANIQSLLK